MRFLLRSSWFPASLPDLLCWLAYELHLREEAVFLTQSEERHLVRAVRWSWTRRYRIALVLLVPALAIADMHLGLSMFLGQSFGISLLWVTSERVFHMLLASVGLIIPIAVLAVTLVQRELGSRLTDLVVGRMRIAGLVVLGLVVTISWAFLIPRGLHLANAVGEEVRATLVHRLGVWNLAGSVTFIGLLVAWLCDAFGLLLNRRRFALVSRLAITEYSAVWRRPRQSSAYLNRMQKACEEVGLAFSPYSPSIWGVPWVEAERPGPILDVNVRRLRKLVGRLDDAVKRNLVVVGWPGDFVDRSEPLIRNRGTTRASRREVMGYRTCFLIGREREHQRHQRRDVGVDAVELVTQQARKNVGDPPSFAQWLGLLGRLATLGSGEQLDWLVHGSLSELAEHAGRSGIPESQRKAALQLYQQAANMLQMGAFGAVRDYLSLLQRLFSCSLSAQSEQGVQQSWYYLVRLGMEAARRAQAGSADNMLSGALRVLTRLVWVATEMVAAALKADRSKLAEELWHDLDRLVKMELPELLWSSSNGSHAEQHTDAVDLLGANLKASGFYLGTLVIRSFLRDQLSAEVAQKGLTLGLSWAKSPAELFAALEQVEVNKLWMGPEKFRDREISSPLGETFWGDDRGPFVETYVLGSVMKAFPKAHWPRKSSRLAQSIWLSVQAACVRVRAAMPRYQQLVPQLTEAVLKEFEEVHGRLAGQAAEEEKEKEIEMLKQTPLSTKAIAKFAETAVQSSRVNSMLLGCFQRLAPSSLRSSQEVDPSVESISGKCPKKPFVLDGPGFIASGEAWARWNDTLCLSLFNETRLCHDTLEEAAKVMAGRGVPPELLLVSPGARRSLMRLPGFRWLTPEEHQEWSGQGGIMGFWTNVPVFGSHHVPQAERWLVNLSHACKLVEHTAAEPRVQVDPDDPLEVIITFPQRLVLKLVNPEGAVRALLPEKEQE